MAALSPRTAALAILLTLACTTMLLPVGQAEYFPIISIGGSAGCWKAVSSVKGCAVEVITSLLSGKIDVGHACCSTLIHIEDSCLSKLFPWNPFIPKLKQFCSTPLSLRASLVESKVPVVAVKDLLPGLPEITKCWSPLVTIKGCVDEVIKSFTSGEHFVVGHDCCKAVGAIGDLCWPQMFPSIPPLLKKTCGVKS